MTPNELMINTNHYLIKDGKLTEAQKANIVRQFLAARSNERLKQNYYRGVRYPNNADKNGEGQMYPIYYIPPYNGGKKLQTVIPMSPQTHILSANSYELEIIRLLLMFAPDNPVIKDMVRGTLERLRSVCFANDCSVGECFHTTLPVLRFIAAAAPCETMWINKLLVKINEHIEDKLRSKQCNINTVNYFWLCLSELPYEIAKPELTKHKNEFYARLNKSAVMNSEKDKIHQPVLYCIFRNCLSRFPEYEYIKDRQPYINLKNGRLYFMMDDYTIGFQNNDGGFDHILNPDN